MTAYDDAARLTLGMVARRNPIQAGVIAADLGLVNSTPHVLIDGGGERRRAAYLAPHAIRVGGAVFWERQGAALDSPLVVPLTTYQTPPRAFGGAWGGGPDTGTGPGQSGSDTPVIDTTGTSGFGDEPWGGG